MQFAGAPMARQMAPQMAGMQMGQPMMATQPQVQYAGAPQYIQAQPQVQYAGAAPAIQQSAMQMQAAPAIQQAPVGGVKVYTPQGAEMLQVTVFGTKQLPGANRPQVEIGIDGKPHKHTLDVLAITGPQLTPKSLVTYYLPGENLNFIVSEGGNVLGDVQISGQDFHPNGLEGDLPLMDPQTGNQGPGYLMVKIVPLGVSGQMEALQPVQVSSEAPLNVAEPPPYVASTSAPRAISPEEYQRLGEAGAETKVLEGGFIPGPPMPLQPTPTMPVGQMQPQATMMRPMAQPQMYAGAMPAQTTFAQPGQVIMQPQTYAQPQGGVIYR
eukprot:TRINITY_DN8064_c0_g1_i1.p1 TRINITY_DN8064_c0_g1~~TRINITY_DN8064_c0_g1_i1.p1  ORF type:complete len:325 (-),score=83.96 TRINITY_DN8064_c0_g1_i1:228-1202(-)